MNIPSVQPRFGNLYTRLNAQWVDVTADAEVTPAKIKQGFGEQKVAYALRSESVIAKTCMGRVETSMSEHPIVLDGEEAGQFEQANDAEKVLLLNKWFNGQFRFNDVSATQLKNLDAFI
jgi:hypothetical protein